MLNCKSFLMLSVLAAPAPVLLAADEAKPAAETAAAEQAIEAVPKNVIDRWITDLDSDNFDTRQAATRNLSEAGKQVIEHVRQAATGDSLEVTSRTIDVLAKLLKSEDKKTADAAKSALEQLAKSDHKAAARRAGKALKPPAPEGNNNVPGVIVGNGGIQIQIQPGQIQGARIIKLAQRNANGEKSIDVEDDGRKISITESKKDGIKMSVTEKDDNGKEQTKTYKAKNAEELKKQHPEAYKLYDKYGKGNAAVGNIQFQAKALPAQIRRMLPQNGKEKKALEQMQKAQQQLEELRKKLKELGEESGVDGIEKISDQLKEITEQIEASREALDRSK